MVGEGVGVGVAVCVTAPEVFNPAWRQNLPRIYGALRTVKRLNIVVHWHAVGCLGQCVLFLGHHPCKAIGWLVYPFCVVVVWCV